MDVYKDGTRPERTPQDGTPYEFIMYAFTAFIFLPAVLAAQVRLPSEEKSGHMADVCHVF